MKWMRSLFSDKSLSVVLGIGLVLFSLHNEWFIYHTGSKVLIFLPQWGFMCLIVVSGILYVNNRLSLGPKVLWIPILLMILSVWITCFIYLSKESLARGLFLSCMPLLYLTIKVLGLRILWPVVIASVIEAFSVIYYTLFVADWSNSGSLTNGGLLSESNYAMGTAFMAFGMVCGLYLIQNNRWKAAFIGINILGMIFSGSPEALVILFILGCWFLYKRDWNTEIKISLAIVTVLLVTWFSLGAGTKSYTRVDTVTKVASSGMIAEASTWEYGEEYNQTEYAWGQGRFPSYKRALVNTSLFGHGYYIYAAQNMDEEVIREAKVHNVPLVIWDQVGFVPFVCWIFITGYCLFKSRYKYLWLCLIALGLFNHTTWTVFAPYWWLAIGLIAYEGKEYVFRPDKKAI